MAFDPNPLYYWMVDKYVNHKTDDDILIFCNEGSSRSSKTFDAFHLIYTFCNHNPYPEIPLKIYIFRNTLKNCREKTYESDFKTFAKIVGFYNPEDARAENIAPEYTLFGHTIYFRGLDKDSEATTSDIIFLNETLEVQSRRQIEGWELRCTKLAIYDWNPKTPHHWIFDYEAKQNAYFSLTTYKNNKHLPKSIIRNIESRSPWHLDDLHLPIEVRRPHDTNIANKTADEWYFRVYGMGERCNRDNLVFPNTERVSEIPDTANLLGYGIDFSNAESQTSDPHAVVAIYYDSGAIYIKGIYQGVCPVIQQDGQRVIINDSYDSLASICHYKCPNVDQNGERKFIADRANGGNIRLLANADHYVDGNEYSIDIDPYEGQYLILDGIKALNSYNKIYLVDDCDWIIEQFESYSWDLNANEEADATKPPKRGQVDHAIAASRYAIQPWSLLG